VFFFIKIALYPRLKIRSDFFAYILCGLIVAGISCWFWYSLAEINVYFTLVTLSLVIISGFEFFKKGLKWLILIILIIALYEYITKTYLFIVYRNTEWGLLPMDPKFFGGYAKIIRAKGLFEGPLALAQFAIGCALIFRKDLKILILTFLLAILANGRLGIIICASVLIFHFIEKYSLLKFLFSAKGLKFLLLGFVSLILAFNYFVTEKSIKRFKDIFDTTGDTGNSARLDYWAQAVDVYWNYDIIHKIFGDSGLYRHITGNSAENGWLMLLLNNGLLGFLYYFIPIVLIFVMSITKKTGHYLFVLLIIFAMFIQTFHLGASANLLYWVIIYTFYLELNQTNNA
jgi:hypothetical protein